MPRKNKVALPIPFGPVPKKSRSYIILCAFLCHDVADHGSPHRDPRQLKKSKLEFLSNWAWIGLKFAKQVQMMKKWQKTVQK